MGLATGMEVVVIIPVPGMDPWLNDVHEEGNGEVVEVGDCQGHCRVAFAGPALDLEYVAGEELDLEVVLVDRMDLVVEAVG